MRLALGASRRRLIRQLLTESFMLALLGGVAGLLATQWTVRLLPQFFPANDAMAWISASIGACLSLLSAFHY